MTVGYERYAAIIASNNSQNLRIELIRQYFEKAERIKVYTSNCGPRDYYPKSNLITGVPGMQYAFFIVNEKHQKLGKLRTVSFYLGENGLPMEPFRIRIYKADEIDHAPGTDLFLEQVFFKATESGKWYTCDLRRYNIAAPQEGYFVAVGFGKPTDALTQPSIENYIPSGYIMRPPEFIRPVFKSRKSTTWKYSPNIGWNLLTQIERLRLYNAMIKTEVEVVE